MLVLAVHGIKLSRGLTLCADRDVLLAIGGLLKLGDSKSLVDSFGGIAGVLSAVEYLSELSIFMVWFFQQVFFSSARSPLMKLPLSFLVVLLAGTTAAYAQKISLTQVPAIVKTTFATHFPTIKTVAWKKETQQVKQHYEYETHNDFWARDAFSTQDVYEADFKLNGQKMSVVITPTGRIQETEITLKNNQLPLDVQAALARDFTTSQVQEVAAITKADGSTLYEAEVTQAGKKQDMIFTADGQPVPR